MYQIITWHLLNIYNLICRLYLRKTGGKRKGTQGKLLSSKKFKGCSAGWYMKWILIEECHLSGEKKKKKKLKNTASKKGKERNWCVPGLPGKPVLQSLDQVPPDTHLGRLNDLVGHPFIQPPIQEAWQQRLRNLRLDLRLSAISLREFRGPRELTSWTKDAGKESGAPRALLPAKLAKTVSPEAKCSREEAARECRRNAWPNPLIITI